MEKKNRRGKEDVGRRNGLTASDSGMKEAEERMRKGGGIKSIGMEDGESVEKAGKRRTGKEQMMEYIDGEEGSMDVKKES